MTRYAEPSDLETPALGLPKRALENIDGNDVRAALEHGSRMADSFLSVRYVLPLIAWGSDLTSLTCHIASYHLMIGRGFNPSPGSSDDHLRLRYEDAIALLKRISENKANLVGVKDSSSPSGVIDDSGLPEFVSDLPRGWR
jgi:phage gp36-like protein